MLLDLGLHTLCEKPLALTIRGCDRIIAAAERSGKLLSVAENFRRDPINRLVRALLDDGAIGDRQFIMETAVARPRQLLITPWRHKKLTGAITLDAGVHNADILQYYFGDADSAFGQMRLFEKTRVTRRDRRSWRLLREVGGQYARIHRGDWRGRDVRTDHLRQWDARAVGRPLRRPRRAASPPYGLRHARLDHLARRPQRPAGAPRARRRHGDCRRAGARLCAVSYRLEPVAATLFGGERIWTYDFDFPATDRKLLALEYHELARVRPHRDATRGRWRGGEARRRACLRPLRIQAPGGR